VRRITGIARHAVERRKAAPSLQGSLTGALARGLAASSYTTTGGGDLERPWTRRICGGSGTSAFP